MTPPSSRIAFVAPDAWPASFGPHAREDAFADGAKTSAMPVPAMMNGATRLEYATSADVTTASHAIATACSASPATMSGREPMRSLSRPAIGATNIGIAGPRQRPQPGLERPVALRGLEELRQQEDRAEDAEEHRERDAVGRREAARAEEAHRQHRRRGAQLPRDERDDQRDAADERDEHGRRRPAERRRADDPERQRRRARRPTSPRPGRSSLSAGPCDSVSRRTRERRRARARSAR